MSRKRAPGRTLEEWMTLVTQCRQSGLSDAAWCEENGISASSFYNAVTRLRRKACQIPAPLGKSNTIDITSAHQDVVRIDIEPEQKQTGIVQQNCYNPPYLDNSHTIEIEAKGICIRMNNAVAPALMETLLKILKEPLC